ncbi:hypothetical protein [Desulfosporosinus shakirovi]|nr:hypothetical protein [Desulfosporosinus sp. SRJS8]MCB8818680.1 hypothetical protein [Desulfosporosinus sp. SRJS8]
MGCKCRECKDKPASARFVIKRISAVMRGSTIADGCGSDGRNYNSKV